MRNVLDQTPAHVITTSATNARGTQFGTMRHVVTRGQVAQHALHLESDTRAAERIAQGRHDAAVRASDQFRAQLVALPVIVTVTHAWEVVSGAVAEAVAADAAAAGAYREAVETHRDHGHDAVVEAADAWLSARLDTRAHGVDLEPLPAELAEAMALIGA